MPIATVAKITAGYCVTYQDWDARPHQHRQRQHLDRRGAARSPGCGRGRRRYLYGPEYGAPEVRVTTDLVTWSAIDPAGLAAEMFDDLAVGGGLLMGVIGWDLAMGAYTAEVGPAVIAPIALPLRLMVVGVTPISLPLRLESPMPARSGYRYGCRRDGCPGCAPVARRWLDASAVGGSTAPAHGPLRRTVNGPRS